MRTLNLIFCWAIFALLSCDGVVGQQSFSFTDNPPLNVSADPHWQAMPQQVYDFGPVQQGFVEQPVPGAILPDAEPQEAESFPKVDVTGFFHLDGAYFSQDAQNRSTVGDIEDGLGFRRARLAAKGNVTEDTSFIIEFDIAQSQARFVDVWFQVEGTRFGNVRIGRFRQPFGMSELTSVRELPFLERPLTFTQSPFRQTGIMLFDTTPSERGTWAVAGYRFLSDNFGNVFGDDGGYGLTSRLTRVVSEWGRNRLFHLGVDYSFNDPARDIAQFVSTNEVFVGQNPNLGPAGLSSLPIIGVPPFVNTGALAAETVQLINAESALALGPLAIQAEGRYVSVEQPGGETLGFPGGYVQARLMLTGEELSYNKSGGVFGRVVPNSNFGSSGGLGAWELLGRVSYIDLNDGEIEGRELTNFTVGCNWYWNRHTKIQFNWIRSQLDDLTIGESDANTFALRAQLDF